MRARLVLIFTALLASSAAFCAESRSDEFIAQAIEGNLFEVNDYDSEALAGTRHRLSAELRLPLSRAWATRASVGYRHSDYDDPEIDTEQRIELGASAELALTDRWMLALQYAFTDNDGAPEFSYRRNRVFARVDVTF